MSVGICGDCRRAVEAHHPGYWPKGDPDRVFDLERQLAEAQAEIIAQKRITESIINVDVAGLRKAWKADQVERDEARAELTAILGEKRA